MKKLISVKLDPELIKYLDNRSKKENRARNNLIETILINDQKTNLKLPVDQEVGNEKTV